MLISLSHPLSERAPVYPGDPCVTITTQATFDTAGYRLHHLGFGEHAGTHYGAPAHFTPGAATADQLDPEDFFLPGSKIDIRHLTDNPDYAVTLDDLLAWEQHNGPFPRPAAVLLHTGQDRHWSTPDRFCIGPDGTIHHPGFSTNAVGWLIETGVLAHRGALGTDAFSPDPGNDTTYSVSRLLYQRHRLSLENLAHLDQVPAAGFTIIVGGFATVGGTGSPAAIYAHIADT